MRWAAAFYGAMGVGTVALSLLLGRGLPIGTVPETAADWLGAVGLGSGAGLAMVAGSRWMERRFVWSARLAAEFSRLLGRLGNRDVVALAALSACAEELLFRGLLLPWLGLWVSSLLFGLVHFVPERVWLPWTALAIGAGFVFGGVAILSGSVLAPIVAHFVVNLLNLRALALRPPELPDGRPDL